MKDTLNKHQYAERINIQRDLSFEARQSYTSGMPAQMMNFDNLPINQYLNTFDRREPCRRDEGHFDVIKYNLSCTEIIMSTSN